MEVKLRSSLALTPSFINDKSDVLASISHSTVYSQMIQNSGKKEEHYLGGPFKSSAAWLQQYHNDFSTLAPLDSSLTAIGSFTKYKLDNVASGEKSCPGFPLQLK